MFCITKILCHCQTCLSNTHTRSRWLVHLSEHQGCFFQNSGFFHFAPEVITFSGTLSNTCENRVSAMFCSYVLNQFLDQNSFTYTGTTKQTNLTTFCIWSKKVNNFDSCFQDLYCRFLIFKGWRISVDYPVFCVIQILSTIYCISKNIKQSSKSTVSNRNLNTASCCGDLPVTLKPLTGT